MLTMEAETTFQQCPSAHPRFQGHSNSLGPAGDFGLPPVSGPALSDPRPKALNNGVGWIQVVSPGGEFATQADQSTGLPIAEREELSAARGIFLGVAVGLAGWLSLAGTIFLLFTW